MMPERESSDVLKTVAKFALGFLVVFLALTYVLDFFEGYDEAPGRVAFMLTAWGLPPAWVILDARKRGAQRPVLWGVFVLLTWIVGLVVYLMLRSEGPSAFPCDSCGREVQKGFAACPYCGQDLRPRISRCPSCKRLIDRDWSFCPYCKAQLSAAETPQ